MKVNVKLLAVQIFFTFLTFAVPLFLAAGTLNWIAGWAFLILFFGFVIAISYWLLRNNPDLLTERMKGAVQEDQKTWDKIFFALVGTLFVVWLLLMPLDAVRFGWSHVPGALQAAGGVIFVVSFYLFFVTFRENSFLSPAVRVQDERGQTVITTGPYHYVRHPMYAAFLVFVIGAALLLGSWLGLVFGAVLVILTGWRAVNEENVLRHELQGYDAYMTQVKYRFVPYVW